MTSQTEVRARVDEQVKLRAAEVLAAKGLSVADAIRLLLGRVAADRKLPFDMEEPNSETRAAMAEVEDRRGAPFDTIGDLMADLNEKD